MLIGSVMLIKTDAEFLRISSVSRSPGHHTGRCVGILDRRNGHEGDAAGAGDGPRRNDRLGGHRKTALAPQGQLAVHGELWEAVSEQPLRPGDEAEVTGLDGLRLRVKPFSKKKEV